MQAICAVAATLALGLAALSPTASAASYKPYNKRCPAHSERIPSGVFSGNGTASGPWQINTSYSTVEQIVRQSPTPHDAPSSQICSIAYEVGYTALGYFALGDWANQYSGVIGVIWGAASVANGGVALGRFSCAAHNRSQNWTCTHRGNRNAGRIVVSFRFRGNLGYG
jgi:hypothetical protein